MAGYRMQFFADQGLLEDVSDVWDDIGSQYSESYKIASTGLDGKQYFVPQSWYPWGLHFRKSMMEEIGLAATDVYNWDDMLGALKELKGQGLIGLAAADKGVSTVTSSTSTYSVAVRSGPMTASRKSSVTGRCYFLTRTPTS